MNIYNKLYIFLLSTFYAQNSSSISIDPIEVQSSINHLLYAETKFKQAQPNQISFNQKDITFQIMQKFYTHHRAAFIQRNINKIKYYFKFTDALTNYAECITAQYHTKLNKAAK